MVIRSERALAELANGECSNLKSSLFELKLILMLFELSIYIAVL